MSTRSYGVSGRFWRRLRATAAPLRRKQTKANRSSCVILGKQQVITKALRGCQRRGVARPKNPANVTRDAEIYARSKNGQYELATLAKDYKLTPQRIGQVIQAKDAQVYAAWKTGRFTLADLADEYGLSPEQVAEIVTVKHPPPVSEEAARSILRARLDRFMIAVQEVVERPGYKLMPSGKIACDDDGKPLLDVGAKIEAMKLQLAGMERAARLEGGDKPQRTHISHDVADQQRQEAWAAIVAKREEELREMEELRRGGRPSVVRGEVVGELPAAEG